MLNDQLWRKINGTTKGFFTACGFHESQTSLKNEKKKNKKQSQKKLVIKDEHGENFDSHEVSDLHRSLLHSLGVQLGKERKLHSGEDFNICNYVEGCVCVFVSPVCNKPLIFIGGYVFLGLGSPTGGLSIDQGSVSMQVKGDFSLRWAEKEMGSLPRAAGNQTASPPGRWPRPGCPSRSK